MMLQILLLLLPALVPSSAWIPVEDWGSGNVTASVGGSGSCDCHVFLPDTTFPADRVQLMQEVTRELTLNVDIQIKKLGDFTGKLGVYLKDLAALTDRVEVLESSPDKYIKLDFELLRIELREFEALVTQLKDTLNSNSPLFDNLYIEIRNMTHIVNQLESYDKSNLEVIRAEFAKLQKKLEECQTDQDFLEPDVGNCNHTGIMSLSKPTVVQMNGNLAPSYVYGGWGRDSNPVRGQETMYFYSGDDMPASYYVYLYSNYKELLQRTHFKRHDLTHDGMGNNYIVHGNTFYYQINSPLRMMKLNMTSNQYESRVIPAASDLLSYNYYPYQSMDFAADESGLWVLYASEANNGLIVIAKLDEKSFGVVEEWNTGAYKQTTANAFMICEVMYATRTVDLTTDEIFYSYNTRTGEEQHLSIPFTKFQEKYSSLSYNPQDRRLYMYNSGYYVSYGVKFRKE
ncbi:olfactomedin-4 [Synchiropus splendidus]|uniref:olfactomedin-4 n=1 Tax=Synchiropus splendidus TaxID=270530 RepID=UPI00237E69C5|nr:olfactomedin-4 [Synchiropus splendidus]